MNIRLLNIDDYDEIMDLWLNTPGMGLNPVDDSREGIEKYLRRNPASCFAAVENGKIVGVILSGHDGRRGFIYHLAVHFDYRKRGIGRQLAERAMNVLEAEGISKAALVVFSQNETGNAFWDKIGFTVRSDLTYRNRQLKAETYKNGPT